MSPRPVWELQELRDSRTLSQTPSFQGFPGHLDRCPLIPNTIHCCSEAGAVRRPRGGLWGRPWLGIPAPPLAAWWAFTRLFQLSQPPFATYEMRATACLFPFSGGQVLSA